MMNELAPGTFQGLAQEEVELFRKVLKGVKGIGVEIGCLDGYSSRVILEASGLHLTSIDPFVPDSMEASLIGSKEKYLHNVAPFGGRAKLVEGYSTHVYSAWATTAFEGPPPEIDFLFIDGDHKYEQVIDDFRSWSRWLVPGGIIAVHDARMGRNGGPNFHEGPSRAARDFIFDRPDTWTIIGEAFSLVIARKNG